MAGCVGTRDFHSQQAAEEAEAKQYKVLVAEDNRLLRKVASVQLERVFPEAKVSFVGCGEEAENALSGKPYTSLSASGLSSARKSAESFDLAFLDHNMPIAADGPNDENAGVNVARNVRRNSSDLSCVLVSYSSNPEDLEPGLFDRVLKKPASQKCFREIVDEIRERN